MAVFSQPGFTGAIGPIVTVTDQNGVASPMVVPAAVLVDSSGNAQGTSTNPQAVAPTASPTGGTTTLSNRLSSAATTNPTLVKAAAARLIGGVLQNTTAVVKWVKFYNKATTPTVGTDTPVLSVMLPANGSISMAGILSTYGMSFALGLGFGITLLAADSDTTAVAAGDVVMTVLYV